MLCMTEEGVFCSCASSLSRPHPSQTYTRLISGRRWRWSNPHVAHTASVVAWRSQGCLESRKASWKFWLWATMKSSMPTTNSSVMQAVSINCREIRCTICRARQRLPMLSCRTFWLRSRIFEGQRAAGPLAGPPLSPRLVRGRWRGGPSEAGAAEGLASSGALLLLAPPLLEDASPVHGDRCCSVPAWVMESSCACNAWTRARKPLSETLVGARSSPGTREAMASSAPSRVRCSAVISRLSSARSRSLCTSFPWSNDVNEEEEEEAAPRWAMPAASSRVSL
mmetsp:Transcript_46260/g.148538  ORF Transcript_46260/g.148538 Transcript_46260/m.148538 type:complete len:281 (+) Transcript_46260:782-1624(+)